MTIHDQRLRSGAAAVAAALLGGGLALPVAETAHAREVNEATGVPVFPGAEGFGTGTKGGRGGRVIEVTKLTDSGPGSLRAALEASGPRMVVFRTGGTITLLSEINITSPFLTVAGQTAPGDGITVRMSPTQHEGLVDIHTNDVVIRSLRFRQGPHEATDAAIALSAENAHNIVVDHCSLSWATDEILTTYDDTSNITISWNIISEALSNSTHYEGEHSRGMLISGDNSRNISVHHNLMAHNQRRNPEVSTSGVADIRNNVSYNWGTHAGVFSDKRDSTGMNVVGNYFKAGPSATGKRYEVDVYPVNNGMPFYVKGNIGPQRPTDDRPEADSVDPDGRSWLVSKPVPAPVVRTTSAAQAYVDVLGAAGMRVPVLDAVDRRILGDVRNGTGRIIDSPSQVGGWPALAHGSAPRDTDHDGMPDYWESQRGLNPRLPGSAADRDGDGYTNIEEYVNGLLRRS